MNVDDCACTPLEKIACRLTVRLRYDITTTVTSQHYQILLDFFQSIGMTGTLSKCNRLRNNWGLPTNGVPSKLSYQRRKALASTTCLRNGTPRVRFINVGVYHPSVRPVSPGEIIITIVSHQRIAADQLTLSRAPIDQQYPAVD